MIAQPEDGGVALGAVRGGVAATAPDPWFVDVTRNGPTCLRAGRDVQLWRGDDAPRARAVIEALQSGRRSFFTWRADARVAAWPERLAIADGASYAVTIGAQAARIITLGVVDAEDDVLTTRLLADLAQRRCRRQILMLLDRL
jgi:hypothetical protein